jgi:hypothetical protein
MKRILPLVLATVLAITSLNALDLTPTQGFRELEGVQIPIVFFADDARKVQWQPPGQWRMSGGSGSLTLLPPETPNAGMELRVVPRKASEAPDGRTDPQAAVTWAQPFLPAQSGNAAFVKELPSPFLLGGLSCREITFTYSYLNKEYKTSVALVNLDLEHTLVVIIYALTGDFDLIHEDGTRSLFRWVWLGSPAPKNRIGARVSSDYTPVK